MNKLFILSGASGAGKSTLLNRLVKEGYCIATTKYTNRNRFNAVDDVSPVQKIDGPDVRCDIIYSMYGNLYGFNLDEIYQNLQLGNVVLITNDSSTIKKLKESFFEQVVVIYVISDINKMLLRQIYMNRHGYPSLNSIASSIEVELARGKQGLLEGNSEVFIGSLNIINEMIDRQMMEEEGFKLRLDSILNRESLFTSGKLMFDYAVLNLYSHNTLTVHATESAFQQIIKIITVETR